MHQDTKSMLTEAQAVHDEMAAAVKKWLPVSYGPLVATLDEWAERLVEIARAEHDEVCGYYQQQKRADVNAGRCLRAEAELKEAKAKLAVLRKRIEDLIETAEYRRSVFGLVHLHPSSITPGNLRALLDGES